MRLKDLKIPGYERVVKCEDESSGLNAIIAIHNTNLGPAIGGCRVWNYKTEEDMLNDVLRLSKAMTYKCAMAGLPFGGGKCVIKAKQKEKTKKLLEAMAEFVNKVGQIYTGEDVGLTMDDVEIMRQKSKYIVGVKDKSGDPSVLTSIGVYYGMKACLDFIGLPMEKTKVLIQGVGNTGGNLAKRIAQECKELLLCDLKEEKMNDAAKNLKAKTCDPKNIFECKFDVFSPCALGKVINKKSVKKLYNVGCKVIAGSANNQLSIDIIGYILKNYGIIYAPDYVINAGGVISVSREITNESDEKILERVKNIGNTITEILERSKKENLPTNVIANIIAEERIYDKN